MSEKIERVYRDRPLTQDEAAEDASVRAAVAGEFPRAAAVNSGTSNGFAASLREAIRSSEKSVAAIAAEAGVSQSLLERFIRGERDLRITTAEQVAVVLGLKLVAVP